MTPDDDFSEPAVNAPTSAPEEILLACCLLDDGATLARAIQDGITGDHFHFPANRRLFAALTQMLRQAVPVSLETLGTHLGPQLAEIGGWPYLMQVTDSSRTPTTAHYAFYRDVLRKAHLAHKLQVARAHIGDRGAEDPEGVLHDLRELLRDTAVPSSWLSKRVLLSTPPKEPATRLFLAGKPICTPGNLTTIISRAKTGKTAALGAATAAIIGAHYDRKDLDCFKFSAPHTTEAVVILDTEQSPYDAFTCHQRTMARAGQADDPPWLHHYALVGMSSAALRSALEPILKAAGAAHGGIFTLILDGVADFVASVNDEAECNEFISYLRSLSITYCTPVICVIHSNEGVKNGDDGRGWLGKELTRKAESNLLLKKDGEVTRITSEKQRKAPITPGDLVAFRWSDEQGRHVSTECVEGAPAGGRRRKYSLDNYLPVFPADARSSLGFRALHKYAQEISPSLGSSTFEDMIAHGLETGLLERNMDNPRQPRYYRKPLPL